MEIGIVGLPNVGKSTLFNALLKKQVAYAANFPFATIEPNIGVVPVPDARLAILADVVKTSKIVPAAVKFVDIAGLVKGASTGEGLGNKFLSHIREVDAILYLLRDFSDENIIRAGSTSPEVDYEVLRTELILADLQTVESYINKNKIKTGEMLAVRDSLAKGVPMECTELQLLCNKKSIVVFNCDEKKLNTPHQLPPNLGGRAEGGINICAKMEEELAALTEDEQKAYLADLGVEKSGLEKVIQEGFRILGLQTFLTAGEIEARAWTIKKGTKAPQAAGVIHTDFEKNFIKADCVDYADFVACGGWVKAREEGKVRQEGRDYVMQENDVVEFKVGV
jgi:ribosome-binding ATPase